MSGKVTCTCGHSWNKSDSSKKDVNVCHICGKDNTMKDGGWLDKLDVGGDTDPFGLATAKTDATSVKAPALKLTKAQLEKNKAINKEVMAKTEKANAKKLVERKKAIAESSDAGVIDPNGKRFAIGDKLRMFPNDIGGYGEVFDDFINPAVFVGNTASALGNAMIDRDAGALATEAGMALGVGALGFDPLSSVARTSSPIIKKGLKSGIKAIDQNFTQVGKQLVNIEKEGIAKGLSPQEIKMQQMNEVGITSMQREGYVPGVSEVFSEYITPMSYDNPVKRVLDIPRRIISGERNSKNLSDINVDFIFDFANKNLLGKPRYDAWRMYSGLPQKNNTFRIAETSPVNHPSYSTEQLSKLEKFSLNNEQKLLRDLPSEYDGDLSYLENSELVEALPELKNKLKEIQELKAKGIDNAQSDWTSTGVMGGYNRRFFNNKMEYNDIWDLVLGKTNVDKYYGKPFMSHGQLDYSFTPAEEGLNRVIEKAEYYKGLGEKITKPKTSFIDATYLKNPKPLNIKDLKENKYKQGGWLDKYNDGGPVQPNYNDASASFPPNFVGDGYDTTGRNYSPAWGGQFAMGGSLPGATGMMYARYDEGGPVKKFMQPTQTFMNFGYNPKENGLSTEYSTSIGSPGEVYLVPGYKQGRLLDDPEGMFNFTGEHLGGPFKTVQAAEDFAKFRHKYVEQNKNIPAPFKTRDYAMGGSMPGSVGFTYARTGSIPSNGKYAKKTMASAQDGKTIYSGMLPEITVVGSKDPQTEEFYRTILDRLTKEEGLEQGVLQSDPIYNNPAEVDQVFGNPISTDKILGRYEGLMDLGKKYGFPKVNPIDKDSLLSIIAMNIGGDRKSPANYDPFSKTIQANSTKQWVSEMAHHAQMKDNKLNKGIQLIKNDLPALAISEIMLGNRKGPYYTPGAVEHEAHSVIEPKLLEEIKKSESKYRQLPYRKKKTEEFYGAIEDLQNGGEMKYYQEGLDFQPKTISRDGGWLSKYEEGGVIQDDMGQWAHPGEITEIGSNQITMQGVPYPVLGISDTGDTQMMYPNQEYQYDGESVTEYPMMQNGGIAYVDSVLNANKNLNWVKRLYDVNRKSIMLPGEKNPSTHFMESGDGRVYPTVIEMPNGKLKHLGDKAYDYADSTNTFIQFPDDSAAQWFGKNYKKGTGVLKKKKQGGQLTKLDQLTNFTNYNTKQPGGWLDKYSD